MSESPDNATTASNEDIIEELTKDLKSTLGTEENLTEFTIDPGTSSGVKASSSISDIPLHPEEREPESKHEENSDGELSDSDSIDESSLKDAEMDLTEDQKEERKIIADQLKRVGNDAFKCGDFERSIEKYSEGLSTCPLRYTEQRAFLYCNRAAAKMKLERYKKAIKDCSKAVELDDKYVKAYIRRAQCYELTEKLDESLADYNKILELDPSHAEARKATVRLPPLIEEKNEKLKTEMLGKLKDLGNMILKPFGLSTENFKLEQDPESKGYKINFKQ